MARMLAHVVAFVFAFLVAMLLVGAGMGMAWLFDIGPSYRWLAISLVLTLVLYWYMRYSNRIRLENRALKRVILGIFAEYEDLDAEKAVEIVEELTSPSTGADLEELTADTVEAGVAGEPADPGEDREAEEDGEPPDDPVRPGDGGPGADGG